MDMKANITLALKNYIASLAERDQWRFTEGLQRELIDAMSNQTTFEKVMELMTDQHRTERTLFSQRQELLNQLQEDPELEPKLLKNDSMLLARFDELCSKQQAVLNGIQLPGFRVTNNKRDIELQTMILEFIGSLSSLYV